MRNLLTISNVSYEINKKQILKDINFTVNKNEILTIVGPNGAGKTTLLSIAMGLIKPSTGIVKRHLLNGNKINIGYVPQYINRDAIMPINVIEFMSLSKKKPEKKEVLAVLDKMNLNKLRKSFLNILSGGELRRVLFARALLNNPHLLVLDEPTAGIDFSGQEVFYSRLNQLKDNFNFSILMVSHDLHLVMSTTDRVICLNKHICCHGKPAQIVEDPRYQDLFIDNNEKTKATSLAYYQHKQDHSHNKEI